MTPPLAIICLDSMDERFMRRWMASGDMPCIKAFLASASFAQMEGPELRAEASAWASMWTGQPPEKHGYYYFQQLVPGTYKIEPISGRSLNVPPFWSLVRGTGKISLIADAPEVALVPDLNGIQLLDYAVHSPWKQPISSPSDTLESVRARFGTDWGIAENPDASTAEDLRFFQRFQQRLAMKSKLYEDLLARGPYDFMMFGFGEIHTAAHQFWKYLQEPGSSSSPVPHPVLSDALRTLYRETDAAVGRLLAVLPNDCNVLLMSSVGLREAWPIDGLSHAFMARLGYDVPPATTPAMAFDPMTVARRIIPEHTRAALGRMILSRGQRDQIVFDKFTQSRDWARTRAVAIPSFYDTQIRINLRGREPNGIVQPGAEWRDLLAEIENQLRSLRDAETGEPVIWEIINRAREASEAPSVLPDLEAFWTSGADWRRSVLHPKATITQTRPPFCRGSHHSRSGFVALHGATLASDRISPLDAAPTCLALLGLEKPPEMQGKSRVLC